jgi:ABC-type antimicrobial peptide transport system ATPase subunit
MDYTVNPGVNKHPGRTNFEALEQMYGRVNDRSRHIRGLLEDHQSGLDWRRMDSIVENSSHNNIEWRMLQRTERSEHYEADLGDGQKLQRVLLLP